MAKIRNNDKGTSGVIIVEFIWNSRLAEINKERNIPVFWLKKNFPKKYIDILKIHVDSTAPKRKLNPESLKIENIFIKKATMGPWSI